MPSRKDHCECGNEKDARSAKCRSCFLMPIEADTKVCTTCKEDKPLSEFRTRTRATPRPRSTCMPCEAAATTAYRQLNPEKHAAAKQHWSKKNPEKVARISLRQRARVLGLDPDVVEQHFADHHGACDICGGQPVGNSKRLSIDHCHKTGEFRGLLCSECNLGLGKFKDNADLLRAAIEYLRKVDEGV